MTTFVRFICLSALLGLFSSALFADGLPPSQENVCDDLQLPGVTPGLFGLCNAYCEAKDCDGYPVGEEPRSCERLLSNYERRAGASDPMMPCLEAPGPVCPCWPPESNRLTDAGLNLPADGCLDSLPGLGTLINYDDGVDMISFAAFPGGCEYINSMTGAYDLLNTGNAEEDAACLANVVGLIDDDLGGLSNCANNQ